MTMTNAAKYKKQYFMPPEVCMDWAKKESVDKAPVWCSVDLRDGNQALVVPMTLDQKLAQICGPYFEKWEDRYAQR